MLLKPTRDGWSRINIGDKAAEVTQNNINKNTSF